MPPMASVKETNLPGLTQRGKVRDLYDLGEKMMIVTTDRLSAFDVIMNEPIPGKGRVLTQISDFWFRTLEACRPHHLEAIVTSTNAMSVLPDLYHSAAEQLIGRTMICRKTEVIPVECVVRGYLIGGGWREYQESGRVSGIELPTGLGLAARLDEPIFTPSTKAATGHDEPISFEQACERVEPSVMAEARERSLVIYSAAADYARQRGMIIADTKFEFGVQDGQLLLIDEVLTPDSSRFWPAEAWREGHNPVSFDKQIVRDYLSTLDWKRQPPPPALPREIIERTAARYCEAFELLTGAEVL